MLKFDKHKLMNFIAAKSKDVKSPMSINGLSREFRTETGSMLSVYAFFRRIIVHRQEIPKMNWFDINTKVKMMFALSASIDPRFLNELKKQADVELDGAKRIVKYKAMDGSLELEGDHSNSAKKKSTHPAPIPPEEIAELMNFIAEKAKDVKIPMSITRLSREFRTETGSKLSEHAVVDRIKNYRGRIPKMNEFDLNTKVKMMFALSASVDAEFLIELRQHGHVKVDENGRIIKYLSIDGSLELEGDHSLTTRQKRRVVNDSNKSNDDKDISGEESGEKEDSGREKKRNRNSNLSVTSSSTGRKSNGNDIKKRKNAVVVKKEPRNDKCEENGTHSVITTKRSMRARRMNTRFFNESEDEDWQPFRRRKTARSSKNVSMKIEVDEMDDDYEYEALNNTMEANIIEEHEPSIEYISEVKQEPMALVGDVQEGRDSMTTNRIRVQEPAKSVINSPIARLGGESSIAVRDMLVALRGPLTAIRSPLIQDTLMNIELKIRELELANKRFPLQKVNIPFNACLYVLTDNAVSHSPLVQYSTSLRDFLICLRAGIPFIRHPSMNSFHQELDDLIQEMTTQDKRVRLDVVHRAVSIAFLTIAP